jgi:nitroreductase
LFAVQAKRSGNGVADRALVRLSKEATMRKPRELPPPRTSGGLPLMEAIAQRRSAREFSDRPVGDQILSDLLWAAFGVNRPDGGRTAPYARHILAIDVYVAMADGVWVYEPMAHALLPHEEADLRAETGEEPYVASAPLNLVYVAHGERLTEMSAEEARLNAAVDAGFIGENVYLFCASAGLATVFRGALDAGRLGRALKLPPELFVTYAQSVGYPSE